MNKEQIKMKKRLDALKTKGEKLFDEEKKPAADTSQKKIKNTKKYKNLWPASEETKEPEQTSSAFKFGDTLPLIGKKAKSS